MGSTPGTDAAAHPHGSLENPEVAHEASDVNIRAVIWFVGDSGRHGRSPFTLSMWGLFVVLDRIDAKNDPVLSPLVAPAGQLPPEPRLQITPWDDLKKFRADEDLVPAQLRLGRQGRGRRASADRQGQGAAAAARAAIAPGDRRSDRRHARRGER